MDANSPLSPRVRLWTQAGNKVTVGADEWEKRLEAAKLSKQYV